MKAPDAPTRPFLLAVNLKSYFSVAGSLAWTAAAAGVAAAHGAVRDGRARLAVLPSFVAIDGCVRAAGGLLDVGAQDIGLSGRGPNTGEVPGVDLVELGCRFALVGHWERRSRQCETEAVVRDKVAAAAACGLTPILCIGEPERADARDAVSFCLHQVASGLGAAWSGGSLVVAYEPVWAIGGPRPAAAAHVVTVCAALRGWLAEHYPSVGAQVIYGGAAGPGLLGDIGADVDGLFLGRRVHDPRVLTSLLDEVRILTCEIAASQGV
jgi:triosephosphate isomerase (TIM)